MANILKIPIRGASAAVVIPLDLANGVVAVPVSPKKHKFDDLAPGTMFKMPEGSAAAQVFLEWERNDAAKTRYPVTPKTIEGPTGVLATTEGDNKPSIVLVSNNIPNETAMTNYKAFLNEVETWKTKPCLVCISIGKGYEGTHNDIGFAILWGRLVSGLEVGPDGKSPMTHSLEFKAEGYSILTGDETTLKVAGFLSTITPPLGELVTFPDITQGAIDAMKAGGSFIL